MGSRHIFLNHTIFSLIIGFRLGRYLGYIEMLNDARMASLGFFKNNVCSPESTKEKNFKIKFQVLLKFAQTLLDYNNPLIPSLTSTNSATVLPPVFEPMQTKTQSYYVINKGTNQHAHLQYA